MKQTRLLYLIVIAALSRLYYRGKHPVPAIPPGHPPRQARRRSVRSGRN